MPAPADRTAVVTGGSRGIGRAVVRRLAAEGAAVVFSYARDEDAARRVVTEVEQDGGRAWAVRADLAERDGLERLFAEADTHGPLRVLVNNAGAASTTPIENLTDEEYDRVMAVNAHSVFRAIRHAVRRMTDGGSIVNVSTVSTIWPSAGESVYAASKAASEQFARVASRELGPRGITVNSVLPGPTDTDLLRGSTPAEALDGVAGMTPLGRLGRPDDVAGVVAFLAGPDARWVTGQSIRADGGLT